MFLRSRTPDEAEQLFRLIEEERDRDRPGKQTRKSFDDIRDVLALALDAAFCNLDPADRRLEIGYTWLGVNAQGTGINTTAKLLLLTRAFEDLGCIAVEFRAHWHNRQSRTAIEKLGAKQDGVLRNHTIFETAR
jgi:RimJ/RimL family protein N-acetyltransferase